MNKSIKTIMTWGDLLAGGGGTTTGALMVPGIKVIWALNHSKEAIYTHEINHPETNHFHADLRVMNEKKLDPIDGLWVSLECTNFSNAKGGLPRDEDSRTLAWELIRYILYSKPKIIVIENVREFLSWGPLDENGKPISKNKGEDYIKWVDYIRNLGYINYDYKILNSADYGAYTSRRRYFGIFTIEGIKIQFPKPIYNKETYKPCKEKIDLTNVGKSIFNRKKPLADKTLKRIAGGIKKFYPEIAYIMSYYSSGDNVHSINEPLPVITTKDRHALIQFVQQHYGRDNAFSSLETPLPTITTSNRHSLITTQFLTEYKGNSKTRSLDQPLSAITGKPYHGLTTISINEKVEYNKNKFQFITKYFSSLNNLESQNSSLNEPLHTIMTSNKHALVSIILNDNFDIKLRFLTPKELADITGFPENYKWYGSNKFKVWMIGNAVPVLMAKAIVNEMKTCYNNRNINFNN